MKQVGFQMIRNGFFKDLSRDTSFFTYEILLSFFEDGGNNSSLEVVRNYSLAERFYFSSYEFKSDENGEILE